MSRVTPPDQPLSPSPRVLTVLSQIARQTPLLQSPYTLAVWFEETPTPSIPAQQKAHYSFIFTENLRLNKSKSSSCLENICLL